VASEGLALEGGVRAQELAVSVARDVQVQVLAVSAARDVRVLELAVSVARASGQAVLPQVELVFAGALAFVPAQRSSVEQPWVLVEPLFAGAAETSGTPTPDWLVDGLVRPFDLSPGRLSRAMAVTERMPRNPCTTTTAPPWSTMGTRST